MTAALTAVVAAIPNVATAITSSMATITTSLLGNDVFQLSLAFTFVMIGFSIVFGIVKKLSQKRV
jgi:hypothetical protein